MIIRLTKDEWIEVIKLVNEKATISYKINEQNIYDVLKTKMLFQFGIQKEAKQ